MHEGFGKYAGGAAPHGGPLPLPASAAPSVPESLAAVPARGRGPHWGHGPRHPQSSNRDGVLPHGQPGGPGGDAGRSPERGSRLAPGSGPRDVGRSVLACPARLPDGPEVSRHLGPEAQGQRCPLRPSLHRLRAPFSKIRGSLGPQIAPYYTSVGPEERKRWPRGSCQHHPMQGLSTLDFVSQTLHPSRS